jgi:hypothetical protein
MENAITIYLRKFEITNSRKWLTTLSGSVKNAEFYVHYKKISSERYNFFHQGYSYEKKKFH